MRLLPERRRRWRLVTLKNAVWLLAGSLLLFMAVSAWNEWRPRSPDRERLYERGQQAGAPPAARPANGVEESAVTDQTFAPGGGAGLVPSPPPAAPPPASATATSERPRRTTLKAARQRGQRVVVTGGADGLRVETTTAQ